MGSLIDLTNQRFERLLVVEKDKSQKRDEAYWICRCDCGAIKSISSSALRGGKTKSCGCLNNELCRQLGYSNKKDLTGERFGKLTVLEDSGNRTCSRQIIWRCHCECGVNLEVAAGNLVSGNTTSCGCTISYGEEYIAKLLQDNHIEYKRQVSFNDLYDIYHLKFDFGIYKNGKLKQLIEFDGKQHYDPSAQFYSENMVRHDKMKDEYCQKHNLPLLRCRKEDLTQQLLERIIQ